MKHLLLSVFIVLHVFTISAKGDEKILKQANALITKGEFQKAAEALEKIPEERRGGMDFLHSATLVYDSLKNYSRAIGYYELLMKESADKDLIVARIILLREEQAKNDEAERIRLEKMKNCMKCSGTGYFEVSGVCDRCNGYKIIKKDCQRCRGNGRISCNTCNGAGSVYSEMMKTMMACNKCSGQGSSECSNMCTRGKVDVECNSCNGLGVVTKKTKCDLH